MNLFLSWVMFFCQKKVSFPAKAADIGVFSHIRTDLLQYYISGGINTE